MALEMAYRYAQPSALSGRGLELATSTAESQQQVFFRGFVERADVAAASLLVVARVARTRFLITSAELERLLDPVVTSEPEGLHFESFSGCCGVHAHLEIDEAGLDVELKRSGTVNVDVGEQLRAALARVRARDPLRLQVGDDAVEVATSHATVLERRVPLPERWVRGFAEVQAAGEDLELALELDASRAQRFLRDLPGGAGGRADLWAQPSSGGARLTASKRPRAVWVSSPERLRVFDPVARHVHGLRVFARPGQRASSVWIAELGSARLQIALSPGRTRGFSGEGGLLFDLVSPTAEADAAALARVLGDRWRFGRPELEQSGLSAPRLRSALTWLGAHGRIAHDPGRGEWFRRELSFPSAALEREPARLRRARALVAAKAVVATGEDEFAVTGGEATYRVRLDPPHCTCTWWFEHPGDRGPCRHLLAAAIVRG